MRAQLFICLTVLCVLSGFDRAYAQGLSSSGTDYWFSFMPNGTPEQYGGYDFQHLFIASSTKNTIKVTAEGNTKSFPMQPNTTLDVPLDNSATTMHPEIATANAVHVTSANPITIYGYSVWASPNTVGGSPDGFLALPITSYGTKDYTVNYEASQFGSAPSSGEFVIVAPYDNTNVTISTKGDTRDDRDSLSHRAGEPWTVSLQKGQSYLVMSDRHALGENDLTGSLITSDQPVAVLTGHQITPITIGTQTSADHLIEMLPPVDRWGTQYFDMPMTGRPVCGDYIRILSAEDGNQITYNGKGPILLNAGEFAERATATDAECYTSINHKKFIVAQYSYSQGYAGDPGTGDPFMILMTPKEQFQKRVMLRTPVPANSGTFNNYLTLVSEDSLLNKIEINGLPVTNYQLVGRGSFPGTKPLMGAIRIKLPGGARSYTATSPTPFAAYEYGFANYEGYGWPSSMGQKISSSDTLAPIAKILDSSSAGFHIAISDSRRIPGSAGDLGLAYVAMITDTGDARWPLPSINFAYVSPGNFKVGDSVTQLTLVPIDMSKDAYAAIYAVDLAGNESVSEYWYTAPGAPRDTAHPYLESSRKVGHTYQLTFADPRRRSDGSSFDDSGIDRIDLVAPVNVQFVVDSKFKSGDTVLHGTLSTIDSTLAGTVTLRPVDVAGNDTSYDFKIDAAHVHSSVNSEQVAQVSFSAQQQLTTNVVAVQVALPTAMHLLLEAYDMSGRRVAIISDEAAVTGERMFYWNCDALPSGSYVIRMVAGEGDQLTLLSRIVSIAK